jgi:hypothetical protein
MTPSDRTTRNHRRALILGFLALAIQPVFTQASPDQHEMTVWKDPNCGCCSDWITHLEENGFRIKSIDQGNQAVRAQLGVPRAFWSCHTGVIEGYVIEGHVPAADIRRLLAQKPSALGLAVPGMPIGSPGMDGPAYGARRDPYDVLLIQTNASSTVFQSYR